LPQITIGLDQWHTTVIKKSRARTGQFRPFSRQQKGQNAVKNVREQLRE
jgi:hypothetical protein